MYHESFVRELFKPQMIYSVQSVRQIFDRLAHSSIMRLNEASMDKLFDLMLMGFKYQLLSCSYPAEVLQVTLTHLRYLVGKVNDKSVADTVSGVSERVMQVRARGARPARPAAAALLATAHHRRCGAMLRVAH
jgi:hypothetical protein